MSDEELEALIRKGRYTKELGQVGQLRVDVGQILTYPGKKLARAERLSDITITPCEAGLLFIAAQGIGRDSNDRN